MINVLFPPPQFKMEKRGGKPYLFDTIRKRWLVLTEEEWVRQNMVAYLHTVLHYPKEAIAIEKAIWLNKLLMRFDIVVYDKQHHPWMLIECKAPGAGLNEDVLQQALRYHMAMPAKWLILSNGVTTIGWKKELSSLSKLEQFPAWCE